MCLYWCVFLLKQNLPFKFLFRFAKQIVLCCQKQVQNSNPRWQDFESIKTFFRKAEYFVPDILSKKWSLTRSCRWSIYRPPLFQLSETNNKKKTQLLGFSFLPDYHYNPYLSSGEKLNPQRCLIYFYETWKVEKEVVDI